MKSEIFTSFIYVKEPEIYLTEWIPFGKNYLTEFIERIMLKKYNNVKYFSEAIDDFKYTKNSVFKTPLRYTKIRTLDFDTEKRIKFIAETYHGNMVVNVNYIGLIKYSFKILDSENKKDDKISFDDLSFIIPKMVINTSKIIKPLLSSSQRYLLETIYREYRIYKDILIFVKEDIELDKYRKSEVKQLVGNIKRIKEFNGSKIIFGEYGILVTNFKEKELKKVLIFYSYVRSLTRTTSDIFLKLNKISNELEVLSDELKNNMDENKIREFRIKMSGIDKILSTIEIMLGFLKEALTDLNREYLEQAFDFDFGISYRLKKLEDKLIEIENTLKSNLEFSTSLTRLLTTLSEDYQFEISKQLSKSVKHQVALGEAMELLEAGIFGVYFLEAVHLLLLTSNLEKELEHIILFGFPLAFWIMLLVAISGIFIGKLILEYRKKKILSE